MNVLNRRRLQLTFFLLCLAAVAQFSQGQHMLFHLLGAGQPIANFTSASQTVAEGTGVWAGWSSNLSAWTKRRQILVDGSGGSLTDFPVMIKLDSTRIDYAQTQAAGQDLRFTNDAGTLLSYEIEKWDEAGTSVVWVKVPTLSAYPTKSSIWMYYGNGAASDAQSSATWDASHISVWHLNGNANDSKMANAGGITGAVSATGIAGSALSFSVAGDRVQLPDNMISNSSVATVEGWFKTSSTDVPIFGWSSTAYPTVPGGSYVPTLYIGNDGKLRGEQYMGSASPITTSGTVNDGAWHHVALVINSTTQSLYLDGQLVGTLAGTISLYTPMKHYIGVAYGGTWPATAGGWRTLTGSIDEFRLSSSARSADWIQASYLAARDELVTFRSEETPTSGAAVITVQLNTPAESTVTIPYTVSGTATAGTDHSRVNGNLVINGGSSSGSLNTYVLRDNLVEGSETAILTLGAPTGASLGPDTVHTVTITDEVLSPPDAVDDSINVTNFSAVTIPILTNDTDANGDTLTIASFTAPSSGTAVRVGQAIRYTPTQDFPASDSFTYTISDGRGGSDTATVTIGYQIPFTWTGAGADTNWNTAGNWLGGVAPGVGNSVYFNNQCSAQCNPTFTANASVLGVRLNSSYTGTIVQNAAYTITTATGGWTQKAGTFTGSAANVTVGGNFLLNGGTFTAPSTTLAVNSGNFTVAGAATFAANGGTLTFGCGYGMTCAIAPGAATYNHVTFAGFYAFYTLGGSAMTIAGNLSMGDTYGPGYEGQPIDNGTLNVGGNVSIINRGNKGSAIVRLTGNASDQTVTGQTGLYMPGLTIDAGVNPVTLVGSLNVSSHYTYVSSGTFTVTGNTLGLWCAYGTTCNIVPGTVAYNNVAFSGYYTTINLGGGTMTIDGNLSFGDTYGAGYTAQPLNNGTLNVKGNVAVTAWGFRGTAVINSVGGSGKTLGQPATAGFPTGTFTINKDAATDTMTQTSAIVLYGAGQAMTISRGTLNLAGYNLTVPGTLTIAANGKLICSGGTVTAGSTSIVGEMSCGPTLGITWTGLAGDGLWTTAGNWTNNTIPGASDIAYFNGSCTNCNATVNGAISVKGIVMASSYTGTLTQGAGNAITVGTSGWTTAGGTFVGGNSAITVTGSFVQSGGTFTSTSGTITTITGAWTVSAGTFNHGSGTIKINNGSSNFNQALTPGTASYNNVYIDGWGSTHTLTGTWTVNGTLTVGEGYGGNLNGGTILASGNVNFVSKGYNGSTLIKLVGSTSQTVTSVSTAFSPAFEIDSTGGTVTFSGYVNMSSSYKYTAGTVDTGTSTIAFRRDFCSATSVTPGAINYYNITFDGYCSYQTITGTLTVNGTLTFDDTYNGGGGINGGTIIANGAVTSLGFGKGGGTTLLKIGGSGNQTVTGVSTATFPIFEIASTGGVVTLAGTLRFAKNFTYTSGTIDGGTSTLAFYGYGGGATGTVTSTAVPTFNNISFVGNGGNWTIAGTVVVGGTLSLADTSSGWTHSLTGGTIVAMGPVSATSYGMSGTTNLKIAGSGNQTISGVTTASFPSLEIASTGGTVTFSGTIYETRSYVHTSGVVDASTSTLRIATSGTTAAQVLTPGATVFNHVELGGYATTWAVTGTMTVNGTMTFNGITTSPPATYNGGAISASGDVVYTASGITGTVSLSFDGSSNRTLNIGASAGRQTTAFTINKTGGAKVTLASNVTLSAAGQDLSITSGTFDLGGYTLSVVDTLTVSSGTTLKCSGGSFSNGTLSNSGTINCPGYSGYDFNWTGAGGNSNWNTAANWAGGVVPGASDVPAFQDTHCGVNCSVLMNVNINVKGTQLLSPYTGTITQASGVTVTLGTTGWVQAAGTFVGGDAATVVNGPFTLSGGSYTATSAKTTLRGTHVVSGSPTFTHNNGTFSFNPLTAGTGPTFTPGSITYGNVAFEGTNNTQTFAGTMYVAKDLLFADVGGSPGGQVNTGTIEVQGNVTANNGGNIGTGVVKLVGNAAGQTVSCASATAFLPNLTLATGTNPVTFGTWVNVGRAYTVASVGTLTVTGSTLTMKTLSGGSYYGFTPGAVAYNNVKFNGYDGGYNMAGGTLTVNGTLTLADTGGWATLRVLNSGSIVANGDVVTSSHGYNGTATVTFAGGTNTALTMAVGSTLPAGTITVNKPAATLTLAQATSFSQTNQDLTITGGTLDMAGYDLTVTRNISNSGTLKRGNSPTCGTVSQGGSYTGTAAICP